MAVLLLASACKDDGPAFVSLAEVCRLRAEDICSGREVCCMEAPGADCQDTEEAQCVALRRALEKESAHSFDSRRASQVLTEQRESIDRCEGPSPVGAYFAGTQAEGEPCQRDAQCASDACNVDAGTCAPSELALCPSS